MDCVLSFIAETMTRLVRRRSMERLQLYDLDKLIAPAPVTRLREAQQRRSSMNPAHERYKFLCNTTRAQQDPVYAATPMFTTIPQSSQVKPRRQLLGSYIRLENVRPLPVKTPESPKPQTAEPIEEDNGADEASVDDAQPNNDDDDGNGDDNGQPDSGSSSSDSEHKQGHDGDDGNDDAGVDQEKGIVEQLFGTEKKPETKSSD